MKNYYIKRGLNLVTKLQLNKRSFLFDHQIMNGQTKKTNQEAAIMSLICTYSIKLSQIKKLKFN